MAHKLKIIAIFTTSRAEFGLLSNLIREIENKPDIEYMLFAGGTHLTPEHGKTILEIDKEFKITSTFDFFLNEDKNDSLLHSLAIETFQMATIFENYKFDFVCILGDRFELLPIVQAAIIYKVPIIHIHGGEISQGAIDEQIRHMITKSAHIHFTACDEYRNNVIRMGEEKWRVHNVGALGIDYIKNNELIKKEILFKELGLNSELKTILLTYHPVTIEKSLSPSVQIENIIKAIDKYNFQVFITAPNIDKDRNEIIRYIENTIKNKKNYKFCNSLGIHRYQSLIPHCEFVIGNSSSGLIEVTYFKIPTINIGDRQKGRIRHESVIDVDYTVESIQTGIEKAMSKEFRENLKNMQYKFGDGTAAKKIVDILKKIKIDENLMRKKLVFPEGKNG